MDSEASTATAARRLTEAALARELGVSRQAINQLVQKGQLTKSEDGLIDVDSAKRELANTTRPAAKTAEAVAAMAPAAATAPAVAPAAAAATTAGGATSFHVARTLNEAALAEINQLKAAELRGELIRVDAVLAALAGLLSSSRDAFMQLPARLAPVLAAESDAGKVHDLLVAEIHQCLTQLAAAPARVTGAASA